MNRNTQFYVPLLAGVLMLSGVGYVAAEETKKPPQSELTEQSVDSRMGNLTRLVNTSSGAKRIEASGNSEAIAKQQEAKSLLEQAKAARESGDLGQANQLLDKATQAIFEGIRIIGSGASKDEKKINDFNARAESIDALLTALERIAAEKGSQAEAKQRIAQIQAKVSKAQALENKGELDAGRKMLDEAFVDAKSAVVTLREGDTLVRSLDFKNPQEEYEYELDRNNTHQMLVKILLKEKMEKPSVKAMVDKFLTKANGLREKAEKEAAAGDHKSAVETMELSTKELVRAIRGAGVYIPG